MSLSVGYAAPRYDLRVQLAHQNSYGSVINLPQDFFNPDGSLNFGNLYDHDQLAAARYTKISVGFDYQLSDHYQLTVSLGRSLSAANTHYWDYESSVGISRSF